MASDPMRKRMRIAYNGGSMCTCVGLIKYLGLDDFPTGGSPGNDGTYRTTRRAQALPGRPCTLLLDNGEQYDVTIVGSMRSFRDAFLFNRPAPKILGIVTKRGSGYFPKVIAPR